MTIRRRIFTILLMLGVLVFLFGCSGGTSTETEETTGSTENNGEEIDEEQYYNVTLAAEPMTLDASKGNDQYSETILINVLEPLTRLAEDGDDVTVEPAGAESWETNEDETVWTFHLRENYWSDGEPVKAQDYEYAIKRTLDPNTGAPYAHFLMPIKNAEEVNAGDFPLDELGVKSLDDKTLEITLERPTAHFLDLTYQRVMYPLREDIVNEHGDSYGSEQDTLIFNGPFVLEQWDHNSKLVLKKNPDYWDSENVRLETVTLHIIEDETARYNSLDNGSIDILGVGKPEWVERFEARDDMRKEVAIGPETFYLFFNQEDDLTQNVNVRRSLSLAVNREEISGVIFHGVHEPAYGWVPNSITLGEEEYRDLVDLPLKQLAEEYPNPKELFEEGLDELGQNTDDVTVKLLVGGTDQWFRTYAEYLQQMYQDALGIKVEAEYAEWPVFMDRINSYDYQIAYMAWGAEYNDPSVMLSLFKSDVSSIPTGWANEEFDELIDKAGETTDIDERLEYYKEAELMVMNEYAVAAPTVFPKSNTFMYDYVKGVSLKPFVNTGYKTVYTSGRPN